MRIKDWVTKTRKTLILQGTKLEKKAETPVSMIATDSNHSGGAQNLNRTSNQGSRNNNKRRQDEWQKKRNGKEQGQYNGKTITECGYCNLIREKGVSQDYVRRDFQDMHYRVSDKSIWPNQCLPWLMLDVDERIKILKESKVFCKICLRLLGMGATNNSCGSGKHIQGNGRNTSCFQYDCDNNITLCKKHEKLNAEKYRLYKSALRWKQRVNSGQEHNDDEGKHHSYIMTVTEEIKTKAGQS